MLEGPAVDAPAVAIAGVGLLICGGESASRGSVAAPEPAPGAPGAGQPFAAASWRPIGLRFTSAAAQLACKVAFSVPMYRLLRAP